MFFATTKIKVERRKVTGESATGEEITEWVTVVDSTDADLQPTDSDFRVEIAGQSAKSYRKVFCNKIDVLEGDRITDLADLSVHKVLACNAFLLLSHLELEVVSGVF